MSLLRVVKIELETNRTYIGKMDWDNDIAYIVPLKETHLNISKLKIKGINFEVLEKIKDSSSKTWCLKLKRI